MVTAVVLFNMILFQEPEPIAVTPGDPIIDLTIETLDGKKLTLDQVADDTFCFFLSTDCPSCREAVPFIQRELGDYHVVLLFVKEDKESRAWIKSLNPGLDGYLVRRQDLAPFNIKTLPALLAYRDSKLKIGFHGTVNAAKCRRMAAFFDNP